MAIKDIPAQYAEFERFNVEYEREQFRLAEASARVGAATRDLFLSWFPFVPRRLGEQSIYALIDERLLDAFGFPASLAIDAAARGVGPPRQEPRVASTPPSAQAAPAHRDAPRSYRAGYRIDELGPPPVATRVDPSSG